MNEIESLFQKIESVPDFMGHKIDSVMYQNGYGDTPLHIVSSWGDCDSIKILLKSGADINAQGETGFTPLHCACEQNQPKAIELLVSFGAKIKKDGNGLSPKELAESLNNIEPLVFLSKTFNQCELQIQEKRLLLCNHRR